MMCSTPPYRSWGRAARRYKGWALAIRSKKPLDALHRGVQSEGIGRQMGAEIPDLADGRLEVLAELVGDPRQNDLHAVFLQVLLHMEVGAGVEVHQQLAGDQHPGLAAGAVPGEIPQGADGSPEGADHLSQSLLGCLGDPLHTGLEHPVGLAGRCLVGPDLPAQLLQDVQHGEGPGRQQHGVCAQHGHAGVDALGVAGVGGEDGDISNPALSRALRRMGV